MTIRYDDVIILPHLLPDLPWNGNVIDRVLSRPKNTQIFANHSICYSLNSVKKADSQNLVADIEKSKSSIVTEVHFITLLIILQSHGTPSAVHIILISRRNLVRSFSPSFWIISTGITSLPGLFFVISHFTYFFILSRVDSLKIGQDLVISVFSELLSGLLP